MKAFGVRLAAGIVTILFGAYAAALAQKDKQNSSESWTAEAPSLGQPAEPIAGMDEPSWLSGSPPTTTDTDVAPTDPKAPRGSADGQVQLVQHTQPADASAAESPLAQAAGASGFDVSMLPATLSDESANDEPANDEPANDDSEATLTPDWAIPFPGAGSDPQTGDANAAVGLTPDDGGFAPNASFAPPSTFAAPADMTAAAAATDPLGADYNNVLRSGDESSNPMRGPNDRSGFAPPADNAADTVATGGAMNTLQPFAARQPFAAPGGPSDGNDPSQYGFAGNSENADPDNAADAFAGGPQAIMGQPQSSSSMTMGQPQAISDTPGAMPQSTIGLAQQSPVFAQSAQQFDQPAAMTAPPASSYGVNGNDAASNSRIASLGGNSLQVYPSQTSPSAPGAIEIDPTAVIDAPGDRRLEGAQSPSIVIQKRAPSEVKVGKPASFVIHVQNVGSAEALEVRVHDKVPAGMRLVDASPAPVQQGDVLMWQLGAMPAGDERTVTMQLVPEQEGELGSVARVTFEAAASVRTISTRPELKIVQNAPPQVLIGQQLEIELEVSNPGTGAATGVVLQEDVPEGLEHPKGRQLDNLIGTLAPGELRRQVLRMRAVSPGTVQNTIRLTSDDGLTAEHSVAVEVIAPQLQVDLTGPSRRFLERQATYQLEVANVGTADATNVELAVQLDRGFTFVSTEFEGQYDPSRHAVYWSLASLPSGGSGTVPLTLLPVEEGEQALVMDARADLGIVAKNERAVTVEAFAELSFQITNPGGPIELGAETAYEIVVTNSGSKAASNVRVQMQLPAGLELVSADGDAGTDGHGLIVFQPKPQLAAGGNMRLRVRARGIQAGPQIVKAVVTSDQATTPVTKEESTLVYADR